MQEKRIINIKTTRNADSDKKFSVMSKSDFIEIYKKLSQQFPEAFKLRETRILKVEIHKDLRERSELKSSQIYKFLRMYCGTNDYRKAHCVGAKRYDLDGNQVGEVTQEQVNDIAKNIKARKKPQTHRGSGAMRGRHQQVSNDTKPAFRKPLVIEKRQKLSLAKASAV